MQAVAVYEYKKCFNDKINFMLNTQIPYFKEKGFLSALGFTYFWLGYEYRKIGRYEKAIEAFKETMKVMPPENEYYANAKAAIYCETKVLNSAQNKDEVLKYMNMFTDSKLYEKSIIFEIFTNAEDESNALQIIRSLKKQSKVVIKNTIKKNLPKPIINKVKKIVKK